MKKLILYILVVFTAISCNTTTKTEGKKVGFGIHKVTNSNDIPGSIIDSLKSMKVLIDTQRPATAGYIHTSDSLLFKSDYSIEGITFCRIQQVIKDKGQEYYAIAAINPISRFSNSDISKTKAIGNKVEIYFNLNGAKKWAELTGNHIGSHVAITIDDKIYGMPVINAQIKTGVVVLTGLQNDNVATRISNSLNAGISK